MNRKFLFLINSAAVPSNTVEALKAFFIARGQENHLYASTASPEEGFDRIATSLGEIDGLITVGGDGTFHQAINAVYRLSDRSIAEDFVFGCLRGGSTGNDIGAALGMGDTRREILREKPLASLGPVAEAATGDDDRIKTFDLGWFEIDGSEHRLFFNLVGAGFDAAAVARAKAIKERPILNRLPGSARLSYFIGALTSLLGHKPVGLTKLVLNQASLDVPEKTFMALIMNGQVAGGGLTLNPHGVMDDNSLELALLGDFSRLTSKPGLIGLLIGALRGKPNLNHPKLSYFCRHYHNQTGPGRLKESIQTVEIQFAETVPCQADGELAGDVTGFRAGLCDFKINVITGQRIT
ncbi:diacylglycerol/lipid kinase family protein [candidate division KSB1 bacterium]